MSHMDKSRVQFVTIYVKCFRHYRTRKLVFPKPPNTHIKMVIPIEKWKAYQDRKRTTNPVTDPPPAA